MSDDDVPLLEAIQRGESLPEAICRKILQLSQAIHQKFYQLINSLGINCENLRIHLLAVVTLAVANIIIFSLAKNSNDICGIRKSICKGFLYAIGSLDLLLILLYMVTLCMQQAMRDIIERIPKWTLACFLALSLFLSNIFTMFEISSLKYLSCIIGLSIGLWCWEYILGQKHVLGLSTCVISGGASMSMNLLETEGPTLGVILGIVGVVLAATLIFRYSLTLDVEPDQQPDLEV